MSCIENITNKVCTLPFLPSIGYNWLWLQRHKESSINISSVWKEAACWTHFNEMNCKCVAGMRSCLWTSGLPSFSTWRTFLSPPTVPSPSAWQPTGQPPPPWPLCPVTFCTSAGCGPCRAAKARLWLCRLSLTSCQCSQSEFTHFLSYYMLCPYSSSLLGLFRKKNKFTHQHQKIFSFLLHFLNHSLEL